MSILSCSCHLTHAFTIAHHLSSTTHTQYHSKYIFVPKGYFVGAAKIPGLTGFHDAVVCHSQFNLLSHA
jgi:hypothetical protein